MLTVILEDAGSVLGENDISARRRSSLVELVQDIRCFTHGEPTGVARLDVKTLAFTIEHTCCRPFLVKLTDLFGD